MVRKSALPPGGFDATCRLVPDWDLWIRLAREGPPAAVAKPLVGYRVHDGNASLDTATYLAELEMMEARYGGPVDRVTYYRYLARVCLRMSRQWMACRFYAMAARRDRAYRSRQLAPDLVEVLRSSLDRVRGRLGRPRRPASRQQATDPHLAWKEEARGWLDQFTSRHAA